MLHKTGGLAFRGGQKKGREKYKRGSAGQSTKNFVGSGKILFVTPYLKVGAFLRMECIYQENGCKKQSYVIVLNKRF